MKAILLTLALLVPQLAFAGTTVLTPENTVSIRGEVSDSSMAQAMDDLLTQDLKRGDKQYPIYLVIDSPGGSIDAGEMFIQYAKTVRNLKTVTIFAASMGSAIAQALSGERLITENGVMMFHRAAAGLRGQFETGEIESRLQFYKDIVIGMEKRNSARVGLSLADYKSKVVNEWWVVGSANLSAKTADTLTTIVCSKELLQSRSDKILRTLFGALRVKFNDCPLMRVPFVESAEERYILERHLKGEKPEPKKEVENVKR